ncbi:TIGR04222 domain-containing membrane protein [Kitasatospora sp. HPMI-4]|uniref:TIGR04222 domain-containing membrane protein n=1 Tax=Kitasatospora sp. HPMI-4 TaxID=3448443 RepID=UPI003F19E785
MWYTEFAAATILTVGAGLWTSGALQRMRRVPNPQGLPGRGLPLPETAFLAGGPARVAEVVIVRMQQEGRLIVSRDGLATVTDAEPTDPAEAVLIGAAGPGRQRELAVLRRAVMRSAEIQRIGDRLAERGLMRRPELYRAAVRARRFLQLSLLTTLVLTVLTTALWASQPGTARDTSTPPFFAFLGLLLLGAVWLTATKPGSDRVTPAGLRQLSLMKTGSSPWRPAVVGAGVATAVVLGALALEGVESLEDEELRRALKEQARSSVGGGADGSGAGFGSDAGAAAVAWCSSSSPDGGPDGSHGPSGGSHGSSCGSSSGGGSSPGHGGAFGHSCSSGHGSGHGGCSSGHSGCSSSGCSSSSCSSSSCGSGCGS